MKCYPISGKISLLLFKFRHWNKCLFYCAFCHGQLYKEGTIWLCNKMVEKQCVLVVSKYSLYCNWSYIHFSVKMWLLLQKYQQMYNCGAWSSQWRAVDLALLTILSILKCKTIKPELFWAIWICNNTHKLCSLWSLRCNDYSE